MANLSVDSVAFTGVLKSYPPGEKLDVSYSLNDDLTPASRDWVGLFRVGWSSSRDYYTFEWAPPPTSGKGSVTFAGRRLPPQDKHFYQFCYVSSDGRVRGASSPFQFSSTAAQDHIEDLELVEISEDSLMVLQTKEIEIPENSGLEKELVSVKESVLKLETEKESLLAKYEMVELDGAQKTEQLGQMEEKVADLERQLQAKRESETRLMEKLEKERALAHELTAAHSNDEAQVAVLRQQLQEAQAALATTQGALSTTQGALAASQGAKDALQAEVAELNQRNQESEGKLAQQATEINQTQEMHAELLNQMGSKHQECDELAAKLQEMERSHHEEMETSCAETDRLVQELAIAQQNIAELLGAKEEGIVVNVAPTANQEPPTLPATHINMVDKSAYEALQQAYENIEELYHKGSDENRDWRTRFMDTRAKHDALALKNSELEQRILKCKEEYTAKAHEVVELKRNLHGSNGSGAVLVASSLTDVTALQTRLREMEENQRQVTRSWEVATRELASRKDELKQKATTIAELQEKTTELEQVLDNMQAEFREFQDKHDKVVNEKTARLDQQEAMLNQKQAEKAKLESTVRQLREQLESLKEQAARSSERACPVCNTKFPGRISQQDFEKHVQGHFTGV